ncbi:MAG: hypothetical protein R3321_00555, partial [Nitrososphaeraceae archaeon]|nr:hypothetical protein [Nitrososphaeraceae archaeon]
MTLNRKYNLGYLTLTNELIIVLNKVEKYILNEIEKKGTLCFPLIDSENTIDSISIARKAEDLGA